MPKTRKAKIKANLSQRKAAPGGGRKFLPMSPGGKGERKFLQSMPAPFRERTEAHRRRQRRIKGQRQGFGAGARRAKAPRPY